MINGDPARCPSCTQNRETSRPPLGAFVGQQEMCLDCGTVWIERDGDLTEVLSGPWKQSLIALVASLRGTRVRLTAEEVAGRMGQDVDATEWQLETLVDEGKLKNQEVGAAGGGSDPTSTMVTLYSWEPPE